MLRNLSNTVETHDLKLKPLYKGSTPASGWALYTDTDTYPILKSANEKNFHWNKFLTNLANIKLESDKLNDIQKFWNSINTAFCSTLATNKGLGIYKELTSTYNIKDVVTPPIGHTQYAMGQAAYEHFTRIIRDHITKKETIDNEKSPNAFKILLRKQTNEDGFAILMNIVQAGSPHLGGEARDLIQYVATLKVVNGERLVEYYTRAKEMEIEIAVQKDETGQSNRLTQRFMKQLASINEYKLTLQTEIKEMNRFFKKPTWHKQTPPYNIDEIYDELMEGEVKEIIEIEKDQDLDSINSPIVNAGRINREDIKKHGEKSPGNFSF